jgi:ubiquinol-cytochrome c reductase cytochrome c1 subunit
MRALATALAGALVGALLFAAPALAAGDSKKPENQSWPHAGYFGTYDRAALQRGFQVYKEVCAACHSMKLVAFRSLTGIGFSPAEVKALAATYEVEDPKPNDAGEMFKRPGLPSDRFPSPFPNENAARAANNGAAPPDLSLVVKARDSKAGPIARLYNGHVGGENYIYAVLVGYTDPPKDVKLNPGMSYNQYFAGGQIAMAPPLANDQITFADGTKATREQMARDVTQFLSWAAEPMLEARRQTGVAVMLVLIVLSVMLYYVKKKVWADVH